METRVQIEFQSQVPARGLREKIAEHVGQGRRRLILSDCEPFAREQRISRLWSSRIFVLRPTVVMDGLLRQL